MHDRRRTYHPGIDEDARLTTEKMDAAANRDILTNAELTAGRQRLRNRPGVSWYGRLIIVATLSAALFWEILHLLAPVFMAR